MENEKRKFEFTHQQVEIIQEALLNFQQNIMETYHQVVNISDSKQAEFIRTKAKDILSLNTAISNGNLDI